jgi:hypothetical protein
MKRTVLALALILVLFFSVLTGTGVVNLAKANPNFYHLPGARIISPWNDTYSTNIIQLEIEGPSYTASTIKCWYRVDDEEGVYVDWVNGETLKRELNLTEGTHSISVKLIFAFDPVYAKSCTDVQFEIDTTPPNTTVLSLENKTYDTRDVPLNFTVNEPVTQLAYSLDGQENVTVTGNTTLNNLSPGSHNIVVYAWDTAGLGPPQRNIGASETIYFTIQPFPTSIVIAIIIDAVIVLAAFLFYKRKHKH